MYDRDRGNGKRLHSGAPSPLCATAACEGRFPLAQLRLTARRRSNSDRHAQYQQGRLRARNWTWWTRHTDRPSHDSLTHALP